MRTDAPKRAIDNRHVSPCCRGFDITRSDIMLQRRSFSQRVETLHGGRGGGIRPTSHSKSPGQIDPPSLYFQSAFTRTEAFNTRRCRIDNVVISERNPRCSMAVIKASLSLSLFCPRRRDTLRDAVLSSRARATIFPDSATGKPPSTKEKRLRAAERVCVYR